MHLIESIRGVKFSRLNDFVRHAFELPDGKGIPYSFPGWGHCRYEADQTFWDFVPYLNKHKNKKNPYELPKKPEYCHMKIWLRKDKWRTCFAICADFDRTLNSKHTEELEFKGSAECKSGQYDTIIRAGYKVWARELQEEIGDIGYVYNSPKTGMPKILFLIEYPQAIKHPSSDDAKRILQLLIPKYYDAGCLDLGDGGLFTSYIPLESRDEIMLALRHLTPIKIQHGKDCIQIGDPEDSEQPISVEIKKEPTVYGCVEELPKEFQYLRCGEKFKHFLRILTIMSSLNHKGFGISQMVIARTIGITQRRASQYIKRAIKLGFLKVIDEYYKPEVKAKRYISKGILRDVIKKRLRSGKSSTILPKTIPDGEWHHWGLEAIKVFWAVPLKLLEWIKSIPGWEHKDRWYQMKAIVRWHVKKHPQFSSSQLIAALK